MWITTTPERFLSLLQNLVSCTYEVLHGQRRFVYSEPRSVLVATVWVVFVRIKKFIYQKIRNAEMLLRFFFEICPHHVSRVCDVNCAFCAFTYLYASYTHMLLTMFPRNKSYLSIR